MEDYKIWKSEIGVAWEVPAKCCCFCEHCTDIFYDSTHGPYMFICKLEKFYDNGCDFFEQEEE